MKILVRYYEDIEKYEKLLRIAKKKKRSLSEVIREATKRIIEEEERSENSNRGL